MNASEVEYVIVGALAVAWHGFPRFSADIDFLIRPTRENAERVLSALQAFGFGSMGLSSADFTKPDNVIQLGVEPNRIDLITSLSGVPFEDAWASRITTDMDGVPVHLIGKSALLRNKGATGRAKDRIDAEELRRTNQGQN